MCASDEESMTDDVRDEQSDEVLDASMSGGDEQHLRQRARELAEHIAESYLELGEVLALIRETGDWQRWGDYGSFFNWVRSDFGFRRRKAEQVIAIYRKFGTPGLGYTAGQLDVGHWTKLRSLVSIVDEENVSAWLACARMKTAQQVAESVRRARASGSTLPIADDAHEDVSVMQFRVFRSQRSNIEAALARAHAITGDAARPMKTGNLLDLMASECNVSWAGPECGHVAQRLEWYVANLRRIFAESEADSRKPPAGGLSEAE
jgi:hypothetical protein